MSFKRFLARAQTLDVMLFGAIAKWHSPVLDATLPRISRAADHSKLWFAIAGVLGLFGGRRGKRAALRGSIALGVASVAVNTSMKLLIRRKRPDHALVPLARKLRRTPKSSSFPSGHSASASAFATAVTLEHPIAGLGVGVLADAVAFSRIYTGVHYPGDVLAGMALGAGAALATLKVWPRASLEPAKPTLTYVGVDIDGAGVGIAVNGSAGSTDTDMAQKLSEEIRDAEIVDVTDGAMLPAMLRALSARASVLGIAGGDGSINTAAAIAHEKGKPLLVIPAGTLNHLARDLGMESVDDAADALRSRCAAQIDLATIDGRPFLNTASFGPYAELVDERERLENRIGKWPALAVALVKVLGRTQPVEIEIDGEPRRIWLIFIGNCRYEPSGFIPASRARLDDGVLDVRIVAADKRFAVARLIIGALTGTLRRSKVYEERSVRSLEIRSLNGPLRLSRDGETFDGSTSFRVEKAATPLRVFVPNRDDQSRAIARPAMKSTTSNAAIPSPVIHGPDDRYASPKR